MPKSTPERMVVARVPDFVRHTSRRENHPDGKGFSLVPGPTVYADLEVTLDLEKLLRQLGRKAIDSKAKRASAANGALLVKAINVRGKP